MKLSTNVVKYVLFYIRASPTWDLAWYMHYPGWHLNIATKTGKSTVLLLTQSHDLLEHNHENLLWINLIINILQILNRRSSLFDKHYLQVFGLQTWLTDYGH